jgi:hypothetical protein
MGGALRWAREGCGVRCGLIGAHPSSDEVLEVNARAHAEEVVKVVVIFDHELVWLLVRVQFVVPAAPSRLNWTHVMQRGAVGVRTSSGCTGRRLLQRSPTGRQAYRGRSSDAALRTPQKQLLRRSTGTEAPRRAA